MKVAGTSINDDDPLLSQMPLSDIMKEINDASKVCDDPVMADLLRAQSDFAHWVSSHEIHVLFGGLRNPLNPKNFLFSICDMDFPSWKDFAGDSMLFPAIMKAVWIRSLQGSTFFSMDGKWDTDRTALKTEILREKSEQDDHTQLEYFHEFFVSNHYNPVSPNLLYRALFT